MKTDREKGSETYDAASVLRGHDGYGGYDIFGHFTEVERRADPRRGLYPNLSQYRPGCVCGWLGQWDNYEANALDEGDSHSRRANAAARA